MGQPSQVGVEPRQGGTSAGRMAGQRHPDHGCPRPPRRALHARGQAATLAVAQCGQQSPKWVVCMFSPADAHIAICDHQSLPGPAAKICVADCARVIVKALPEGDRHALLLKARLKDHARAAKPGVWPAAALPADLELQLAAQPRCTTGSRPSMTCGGGANPTANRCHALAGVATGGHAAGRRPRPPNRSNGEGPRCVGPWPHAGAVQGPTGQPAI